MSIVKGAKGVKEAGGTFGAGVFAVGGAGGV